MGYLDGYESGVYGGETGAGKSYQFIDEGKIWQDQYHKEQLAYETAQRGGSSRGGSLSSGDKSTNQTTNQTTKLRFTEPVPETPELPTLELAKPDKRKIRSLTQQIAAPSIRKLQEGLQTGMNTKSDNPNVRRMTLREALQGYGTGLESAMSGAGGQARSEHQQELNTQNAAAQANWQAKTQSMMTAYQNAFSRYMQSAERVTESEAKSSSVEGSGVPMVTRRNAWGTPEVGPAFGYSPREIAAFGYPNR
jgi:hypothetical protein